MNIKIDLEIFSIEQLIKIRKSIDRHLKIKTRESKIRVDYLDISVRLYNALILNKLFYLEDVAKLSIKEFKSLRNTGGITVSECTEILRVNGLDWRS